MSRENPAQQDSCLKVAEAVARLQNDEVVALPSETVYGLAGRIGSPQALEKIFTTKKRPFFDPLIVHVESLAQAERFADWDPLSRALAASFWPGPLTLVLPRRASLISDLITNGGETVALRCPRHEIFQAVLKGVGEPLAAPSANLFGKTSPTQAGHVLKEFSGQVGVVDGGPCETGIESTIVQVLPEQKVLLLLRPGHLDFQSLQSWLTQAAPDFQIQVRTQSNAPGFLKNHYQPTVPLLLAFESTLAPTPRPEPEEIKKWVSSCLGANWGEWSLPQNPELAARHMYADLRQLTQPTLLWVPSAWQTSSPWQAVLDRLQKASSHLLVWEGLWQVRNKD